MLLSITTTHRPATDLGYLLHKNPERLQTTEMSFGQVHVLYPRPAPAGARRRWSWRSTRGHAPA